MNNEKQVFLEYVVYTMQKHPEWFGELVYALQSGLTNALEVEREKATTLAYGLSWFVSKFPAQTKKHSRLELHGSLCALYDVFSGSTFGKEIEKLLEGNDEHNS